MSDTCACGCALSAHDDGMQCLSCQMSCGPIGQLMHERDRYREALARAIGAMDAIGWHLPHGGDAAEQLIEELRIAREALNGGGG